jgi:hypothetical protein
MTRCCARQGRVGKGRIMVNARAVGRIGVLVAGLGIAAGFASIPGTAKADPSDWTSSVDSLVSSLAVPADTTPLDIQISINGSDLFSTSDNEASATSGQGDFAIAYGDGAKAIATGGTGDFSFADGTDTTAQITGGNDNLADVVDPSGTLGSTADAGTVGSTAGDYDFASVVGVDGAKATAEGADYAYAIVNLLDSQSGNADTIGGFLSELVALF